MLLDEDPSVLIRNCIQNFTITPDKSSLTRISDSLSTLHTTRSHRLTSHRQALKSLNRQLSTLQSTHALTVSAHNPGSHAAEILRLDTEKFRVAKEASEMEIEGERLEAEIARAREAVDEVEEQGVEGGDKAREGMEDEILLKLKVYRMLNIDVEPDRETGLYSKAVVRNPTKGDVHVVNIDQKFSRYFYANYFWNTMA